MFIYWLCLYCIFLIIWINFFYCLKVVKVADFGVARFQNQEGVMTAETGTYRWMAPEVWLSFILPFSCAYWASYLELNFSLPNSMFAIKHALIAFMMYPTPDSLKIQFSCWYYLNVFIFIKVINHQPYDQKADIFSFAIVLWELATAKVFSLLPCLLKCSIDYF